MRKNMRGEFKCDFPAKQPRPTKLYHEVAIVYLLLGKTRNTEQFELTSTVGAYREHV